MDLFDLIGQSVDPVLRLGELIEQYLYRQTGGLRQGISIDAVDAPTRRHRMCHNRFIGTNMREASMSEISILAIDLAKGSFQVCGVKADCAASFKSASKLSGGLPSSNIPLNVA
jgi:hypothetical protein